MTSVGVKWKVYTGVSSSDVRNLYAPFVSMSLTTTDGKGQQTTKIIEMKMEQFKEFKKTLQEIQVQMENAKFL